MSTSATQKKSSQNNKAIDRPFAPAILRRARELAAKYRLLIEKSPDGYTAQVFEMTNILGFGTTLNKCEKETRELLTTALAFMIENGDEPPAPSTDEKRTEQVNIRLTALEKARLEEASRQQGYRGLSDFIRSKSLG